MSYNPNKYCSKRNFRMKVGPFFYLSHEGFIGLTDKQIAEHHFVSQNAIPALYFLALLFRPSHFHFLPFQFQFIFLCVKANSVQAQFEVWIMSIARITHQSLEIRSMGLLEVTAMLA